MRTLMIVISLLLATHSAADTISTEQESPDKKQALIDDFAWDGPLFLKDRTTRAQLQGVGKILRKESTLSPNPQMENKEIVYTTIQFDQGLEIRFEEIAPSDSPMLLSVRIASPQWPVAHGLKVGVPLAQVEKVLGSPARKDANHWEYFGEVEHVIFSTGAGRVTEVLFDYYAD